jgi:hypothetical protein
MVKMVQYVLVVLKVEGGPRNWEWQFPAGWDKYCTYNDHGGGPRKLLMGGVRNFAYLRPQNCQIYVQKFAYLRLLLAGPCPKICVFRGNFR